MICGPSGVGKGTLIGKCFLANPKSSKNFSFVVSHTTREPRDGELHGREYWFVDDEEFEGLKKSGKFLETATVHGNSYGTSYDSIKSASSSKSICVLDVDVEGVKELKKQQATGDSFKSGVNYIFIAPPSPDALRERLRLRNTETDDDLNKRLINSSNEIDYGLAEGNFDRVVVNDDVEDAARELAKAAREMYPDILFAD